MTVKGNLGDGLPNFAGQLVQRPSAARFVYIDIGKSDAQTTSEWERRIKIPLIGITWEMIEQVSGTGLAFVVQFIAKKKN